MYVCMYDEDDDNEDYNIPVQIEGIGITEAQSQGSLANPAERGTLRTPAILQQSPRCFRPCRKVQLKPGYENQFALNCPATVYFSCDMRAGALPNLPRTGPVSGNCSPPASHTSPTVAQAWLSSPNAAWFGERERRPFPPGLSLSFPIPASFWPLQRSPLPLPSWLPFP